MLAMGYVIELVNVYVCSCERCGRKWKTEKLSKQCPKCHSSYWAEPRREAVVDHDGGVDYVADPVDSTHQAPFLDHGIADSYGGQPRMEHDTKKCRIYGCLLCKAKKEA